MYPLEYAYHKNSVYRTERYSANCRNYPVSEQLGSENYIHCDGTQLRLADSDIGSEQYTTSEYYVWTAGSNSQLLFIFPTRVNLTNITLHYYHTSGRGLPRLRFYAVPDDFDVWDAVISSYNRVEVAAMQPIEVLTGSMITSVHTNLSSTKVLLYKFSSTYTFALSEVEFFTCNSKQLDLISLTNNINILINTDFTTTIDGEIPTQRTTAMLQTKTINSNHPTENDATSQRGRAINIFTSIKTIA